MRSTTLMRALAALLAALMLLASPSTCGACESDPDTGLICGADVPDYPGWRQLCADGCILVTRADERAAATDHKLAALVPRLRLAVGGLIIERDLATLQRDRTLKAYEAILGETAQLRLAESRRWSAWTWLGIGAGFTLAVVTATVLTLVLL